MSRQDDLRELIKTKTRHLQKLKKQEAVQGIATPSGILIQIEDLEKEIERLQAELSELQNASNSDIRVAEKDTISTPAQSQRGETNWGRIAAIAGVVAAIIAIIALIISPDFRGLFTAAATPQPTPDSFSYQVRVEAKDSGKFISNAKVTIEVGGKAPLDGFTDSSGLAVIFIGASHAGQPGRLIVEADGYQRHTQNIDLTPGALPDVIQLESE